MIEDAKRVNWLEDAIDFDVHIGSDAAEVKEATEYLFKEVSNKLPIRNKARSKETLKNVLTNLWVGVKSAMPIKYSRNRNDYRSPKRYGKLFFKYKRLIPIIDTLEGLGYVPKRIAKEIASKMDAGTNFRAEILGRNEHPRYDRAGLTIRIVDQS